MNPCYSAQSKQQTLARPWGSRPWAAHRLRETEQAHASREARRAVGRVSRAACERPLR